MLRFGPYKMPQFKIGQRVDCEYAGTVRIVGISDAPQQWPLRKVTRHRVPVLYGSLIQAVRREAARDVGEAWGVSLWLVGKWREALHVRHTEGAHVRLSEVTKGKGTPRALKIAAAKRGKPRPAHVMEALRKANLGRKLSDAHRAKLSEIRKRLGTRPPWLNPAWSKADDRLVRRLPPAEAAKLTGRSLSAVYSRRSQLGINNGRTARHRAANPLEDQTRLVKNGTRRV